MYKIEFSQKALEDIADHKKSSPASFKKIQKLLEQIQINPRFGTGHPEPMKGGNNEVYSRAINKKDRLVYKIYNNEVLVIIASAKGHYADK